MDDQGESATEAGAESGLAQTGALAATEPPAGTGIEPGMPDPMRERVGLYPGTFDPVTNGHLDVMGRAARILDRLVVGVAINIGKSPLFPLEERVDLVRAETDVIAARTGTVIEVRPFEGLLVGFAQELGASMIIRGLRAVTDFTTSSRWPA